MPRHRWGMTDWEQRYQAGDTPWEKGMPAPPLLELLELRPLEIWKGGPVLVPGCGTGHDVRALAARGLQVTGVDLAESAVRLARGHGPVGNEVYEKGDFLSPEWAAGRSFGAIWEHTCFCAIDPERRADYARAAAAVLKDGGLLAGVFFLTPYDPGEPQDGPPYGATVEEIDCHFSPWFLRIDAWTPGRAYPGREGREWLALYRRNPHEQVARPTGGG